MRVCYDSRIHASQCVGQEIRLLLIVAFQAYAVARRDHTLEQRHDISRRHHLAQQSAPKPARRALHPARAIPRPFIPGARQRGPCGHFPGPLIWSGNQVAMPGNAQIRNTARNISPTKGITPQIRSLSGMSGATFLMTNMLSPTGGWMSPISITIVIRTPNHTRSNPAALSGGSRIGTVMRMMDT